MTSNKRVKIFLMKDGQLLNFMWADTASDGSVMMGIYGSSFSTFIEKIFAREGELVPDEHFKNIDKDKIVKNTKITFHQSGFYKLVSKIEKDSIDRTTVKGLPLIEIIKPTRMLEVLIPAQIQKATIQPHINKDAVIDITEFPSSPLRCTVFCMPRDQIDLFYDNKKIDTSIIESCCVFEHRHMAWGWALRISKEDKVYPLGFYLFVPGEIVWPKK